MPGYRAVTEAYWEAVGQLGGRLLRLLALSLNLPAEYFAPFFTRPMLFLRPLHYRWAVDGSRAELGGGGGRGGRGRELCVVWLEFGSLMRGA